MQNVCKYEIFDVHHSAECTCHYSGSCVEIVMYYTIRIVWLYHTFYTKVAVFALWWKQKILFYAQNKEMKENANVYLSHTCIELAVSVKRWATDEKSHTMNRCGFFVCVQPHTQTSGNKWNVGAAVTRQLVLVNKWIKNHDQRYYAFSCKRILVWNVHFLSEFSCLKSQHILT